jgi:hypothetical protein
MLENVSAQALENRQSDEIFFALLYQSILFTDL